MSDLTNMTWCFECGMAVPLAEVERNCHDWHASEEGPVACGPCFTFAECVEQYERASEEAISWIGGARSLLAELTPTDDGEPLEMD